MSQCEWILYESGHKFFMKASQILYGFVLLYIGLASQIAVLEHLETGKHFIFVYSLLQKTAVCDLPIWALLSFRLHFNGWINSIIDKNENNNPHALVKTCTINDFLSMILT